MRIERSKPALLIFDADGTLRWTTIHGQPCPNKQDEWKLMPNVREVMSRIAWGPGECRLGIASNQGGVALGYVTRELARRMMVDMLVEAIGYLPAETCIEMCTCPSSINCNCRKPAPGMLLNILKKSGIHPEDTLYIGDLDKDCESARRANIKFIWAKDFFGW